MSKFGMTLTALGVAQEYKGKGVAGNSIWPTTLIESAATKNHNLGEAKHWRKASILTDAIVGMVSEDPNEFSGNSTIAITVLAHNPTLCPSHDAWFHTRLKCLVTINVPTHSLFHSLCSFALAHIWPTVLLDEPYLRSKGVTDFDQYQCVPGHEPPNINDVAKLIMGAGDQSVAKGSQK